MKLTLVLLLVFASVALFKAEELPEDIEELTNDEETPVSFMYDGSMEDEVMGDEEDPGDRNKKQALLRRLGARRVCGRVFLRCLVRTKGLCKLVPVCKVKYFACRCIIKGVRKCKKFLRFVSILARKHRKGRKQDEVEQEDEEEDPRKRRRRIPKFVRVCKAGYRRCSRGKKVCKKCLKAFAVCIKRNLKRKRAQKKGNKKADESEEDEESIMADAVENDDDESSDIEEDEEEDPKRRRKPRFSKKMIRCGKRGVKCMLRARLNCRRQGRCVRRLMKCVRRARRRPRQ